MSQFDLVVAAIEQRQNPKVVEAGWLSDIAFAPFRAMFWGLRTLMKIMMTIARVIAVGGAVSVTVFAAFVWFITGKIKGKIKSWEDAKRQNPKRAEDARECASVIANSLRDPRVQSELRANPQGASQLYDTLDDMGYGQRAAASAIACACADLPDGGVVTAGWQEFFESPVYVGLAVVITAVLGGWSTAVIALLWFMAGIATHKWGTAAEASRHDKNKTVLAAKAADRLKQAFNHPKIQEACRKSPQIKDILHRTLAAFQ